MEELAKNRVHKEKEHHHHHHLHLFHLPGHHHDHKDHHHNQQQQTGTVENYRVVSSAIDEPTAQASTTSSAHKLTVGRVV
jgi:hypothetical protein